MGVSHDKRQSAVSVAAHCYWDCSAETSPECRIADAGISDRTGDRTIDEGREGEPERAQRCNDDPDCVPPRIADGRISRSEVGPNRPGTERMFACQAR